MCVYLSVLLHNKSNYFQQIFFQSQHRAPSPYPGSDITIPRVFSQKYPSNCLFMVDNTLLNKTFLGHSLNSSKMRDQEVRGLGRKDFFFF